MIFIAVVVSLLFVVSCSFFESKQQQPEEPMIIPAPMPEQTPEPIETKETPTKSDTQQIIDNVLAYIEAESEENGEGDYWYGGTHGYGKYIWGNDFPTSINYQSDAYYITLLLRLNHNSEYPTRLGYDFPDIQEDLAVFDVSFTLDYGFAKSKSVFRFNLINSDGWKITDLRLIYTDWSEFKKYVW